VVSTVSEFARRERKEDTRSRQAPGTAGAILILAAC
jgi:hypothetical protein